jgi:ABC-type nickel/cobalt efflux system permease component RcnA
MSPCGRRWCAAIASLAGALGLCAPAAAHPLGNFSVNHLDVVTVSRERVDVRYILDQAEIPTFQERGLSAAEVLARKRGEVARRLALAVDGRAVRMQLADGGALWRPVGQGGLRTTRVELRLTARVAARRHVTLHDGTFPGRVGWKAIVVAPGAGTAVRSSVPDGDPTARLRRYPAGLLSTPSDTRSARFAVAPGHGTVVAPRAPGARGVATSERAGDRFASVFAQASAGRGVLVFLLLAAFGWGAVHALSPGHGKAMVAAYLVGTRGTARHAVALGLTVTVTHTIGVFALGAVTLALSNAVVPEALYPWLNLASGLLVLLVGATVLRARVRGGRTDGHGHSHDHHPHDHGHTDHGDAAGRPALTRRSLLAMGASAGLLPCPSALVVLLGAVAQHRTALGMLLIVAFSAGLAATLTALGIVVVHAGRMSARLRPSGRAVAALPAVSAVVIVVAGALLTARALPGVLG